MLVDKKRLFFAFDVFAPWPCSFPKGRLIEAEQRHLTIAFLGDIPFSPLLNALQAFPVPSFFCGLSGYFSNVLFLPSLKKPNVVAWQASWFYDADPFLKYVFFFQDWLKKNNFLPFQKEEHSFLPHVTIARRPETFKVWEEEFCLLPFTIRSLRLYESLGESKYTPLWSYSLEAPFEEIEHDADLAFVIYGENITQLFFHALTALAFKCPALIHYRIQGLEITSLLSVVKVLNEIIFRMDVEVGCPFKAVSVHGEIEHLQNGLMKWEMIVDV